MKYSLISKENITNLNIIDLIFKNRGFTKEKQEKYINIDESALLNPLLLDGMREGVAMLCKHLKDRNKIFIQVDSDADGYTSSAFLINYLNNRFPQNKELISYRIHEGKEHGIILDTIPKEVKLVITPDSATNNIEEHKILKENGTDVLILDHHSSDEGTSPYACTINNQTCDYPNKTLSGVGIVYKFCSYIDSLLDNRKVAEDYIDLAALGIISDMVPLTELETRYIVKTGLSAIQNPFFKTMCEKNSYSLGNVINPIGIAFYVTPFINATIRSGTQEDKILLFKSMLDHEAYTLLTSTKRGSKGEQETLVEQVVRNCGNIKRRQDNDKKDELERIDLILQDNGLLNNKILVVPLPSYVEKNLVGLIANQLMGKYKRPTILLNRYETEEGGERWSGSARNVSNSQEFPEFREFVLKSGMATFAQGHSNAFGLEFDHLPLDFIKYCNEELKDVDFSPEYKVDIVYDGVPWYRDILDISYLEEFWGQDFPESLIAVRNIKITPKNITLMSKDKNPTLKITLADGVSLIKFKSSQEEFDALKPKENEITYLTIVGRCNRNEWQGNVNAQIIIEDYEIEGTLYDF